MFRNTYFERARRFAITHIDSYDPLEIYDARFSPPSLFKNMSKSEVKVMRKKREKNLKSLEKLSEKIDKFNQTDSLTHPNNVIITTKILNEIERRSKYHHKNKNYYKTR